MRAAFVLLVLFVLTLSACQQDPADPKAEIEAAIHDHLSKQSGLALDKMEMEVQQVDVRGETAEARVVFRIKQGEGEMLFRYLLRRADDRWVVERGTSGGALPPGHPPMTPSPETPEKLPRTSN
ncbi:MAG: hypothetical protein ACE10I_07885 [Candidatus Acidiferrales bacterium]|nr:hypothetical protein [Acidobacteriota bacterium]